MVEVSTEKVPVDLAGIHVASIRGHVAQCLRRGGCMLRKLFLDSGILFRVLQDIRCIVIIISC
jgi:hypothetical protein